MKRRADRTKSLATKKRKSSVAKDQAASAKKPSTQPTSKGVARKKSSPQKPRTEAEIQAANGGLTGKAALALWDLVITGDGKTATQRNVKLEKKDLESLTDADLIRVEHGARKDEPKWGSKLFVKDKVWDWAAREGCAAHLSRTPAAATVLEALLAKLGVYLEVHGLALDHLLRPRRPEAPADDVATTASGSLEARIRAAYRHATGGVFNQYIKLAVLRAELRGEPVEEVDEELRQMQQRGGAVLYPIDDPHRLRPEDEAASLRVAGERRDLFCIRG